MRTSKNGSNKNIKEVWIQFLLFWEEKFNDLTTLKDKNFAPKQNERDCPMT